MTPIKPALAGLLALAAAACATPGGPALPSQVLQNLEACRRTYTGTTSPVPSMSFHITCEPQAAAGNPP